MLKDELEEQMEEWTRNNPLTEIAFIIRVDGLSGRVDDEITTKCCAEEIWFLMMMTISAILEFFDEKSIGCLDGIFDDWRPRRRQTMVGGC
jgi:hypothetical protein